MLNKPATKLAMVIALATALLSSCLNDNHTDQIAYGDAFIKSTLLEDSSIVYNLELYTYSWSEMTNVIAYSEKDNQQLILDTIDYKYTFAYQPDKVDFTSQPAEADDYYFRVTFQNGEEYMATDYLSSSFLTPPPINQLEWDNDNKQVKIKWGKVQNAQLYNVMLLTSTGKPVFESELFENSVNELWINQFTTGWYANNKPSENTKYTVVLSAYLFEPVYSTFDIQCIAVNKQSTFEWTLED